MRLGDIDGDGDYDLLASVGDGVLFYYENTGSAQNPSFTRLVDSTPFDLPTGEWAVKLIDLDADGVLEVVRTDTFPKRPSYAEAVRNPFQLRQLTTAAYHLMFSGDIDNDGDIDLFLFFNGGIPQYIRFFENIGSSQAPLFINSGIPESLKGIDQSSVDFDVYFDHPSLFDFELDGDRDLDPTFPTLSDFFNI